MNSIPLREQLLSLINQHKAFLPVRIPVLDIITLTGNDPVAGIPFDTVINDPTTDGPCLVSEEHTYCIPLEGLPASTLLRVLRTLAKENREAFTEDLADPGTSPALLRKNGTMVAETDNFLASKSEPSAACTHIFECLLQLGGPLRPEDLLDDGCGEFLLDATEMPLPYVTVADQFLGNTIDEVHNITSIEWTCELDSLLLVCKADKREFFFTVREGSIRPVSEGSGAVHNPNGLNLPFESILALEDQVNSALNKQKAKEKAEKASSREIKPLGTLLVLALKTLLHTRGHNRNTSVYFDPKSFEFQADIPHIHTPFGYAAIDSIYIQDNLLHISSFLCGHDIDSTPNGTEEEAWTAIFSQAYTELQNENDPDWEGWLEDFRKELDKTYTEDHILEAINNRLQTAPSITFGEEGFPLRSLPGNAHLLAITVSDGSDDYMGIPAGKPCYGIDDSDMLYVSDGSEIPTADIVTALQLDSA